MPVKIFSATADGAAQLEKTINEWMGKLETGAVRQITSTMGPGPSPQIVIAVWYTEAKDTN